MKEGMRPAALVSFVLVLACACPTVAQKTIPADTPLEIRLMERVSTHGSKKGAPFHAILAAPVVQGGEVLLPLGTRVDGKIVHLHSVGLGLRHETASIGLEMEHVELPDGKLVPLQAGVRQIENSRELVDRKGRIVGVRSTSTISHKVSGFVGNVAFSNPIALIFATASSASLLRFSDPEISLPADTELILLSREPITLGAPAPPTTPALASSPDAQTTLRQMVRQQPYRTVTDPRHVPSDIVNLMFVGEGDAVLRAFEAAGWLEVDSLTADSTYKTIRSISEQQSYRTAPMSTLLLEGERPHYALAKTLDTFSKRHHLRIFGTHDRWQGEPVWLSSSTQDIGIGFSASQKNFIHQIDHNIDHERTKVVNDLLLTGCVTGLNMVARNWLPAKPRNGTGVRASTTTHTTNSGKLISPSPTAAMPASTERTPRPAHRTTRPSVSASSTRHIVPSWWC